MEIDLLISYLHTFKVEPYYNMVWSSKIKTMAEKLKRLRDEVVKSERQSLWEQEKIGENRYRPASSYIIDDLIEAIDLFYLLLLSTDYIEKQDRRMQRLLEDSLLNLLKAQELFITMLKHSILSNNKDGRIFLEDCTTEKTIPEVDFSMDFKLMLFTDTLLFTE